MNRSLRTALALKLIKCKTVSLGIIVLFDRFHHLLSLAQVVDGNRVHFCQSFVGHKWKLKKLSSAAQIYLKLNFNI